MPEIWQWGRRPLTLARCPAFGDGVLADADSAAAVRTAMPRMPEYAEPAEFVDQGFADAHHVGDFFDSHGRYLLVLSFQGCL